MTLGIHILAEFYGVKSLHLAKVEQVKQIVEKAVKEAPVNRLKSHYHQFSPYGVTGFVLLAESHVSIHTWPEKNYLALDVFTCGNEGSAEEVYKNLYRAFKPKKVNKAIKVRGNEQTEETNPIFAERIQ